MTMNYAVIIYVNKWILNCNAYVPSCTYIRLFVSALRNTRFFMLSADSVRSWRDHGSSSLPLRVCQNPIHPSMPQAAAWEWIMSQYTASGEACHCRFNCRQRYPNSIFNHVARYIRMGYVIILSTNESNVKKLYLLFFKSSIKCLYILILPVINKCLAFQSGILN